MLKLAKYLKPYLGIILLTIGLLFTQAMTDLALPQYMSDIVNNGIQQGGVVNAVPQVLSAGYLEKISLFLDEDEKTEVMNAYTRIDPSSPDYAEIVTRYPGIQGEAVYILRPLSKADTDRLNPVIGKAILVASKLEEISADPSKAAQIGPEMGFDLSQIPPGTDLFTLLAGLPEDQMVQIRAGLNRVFAGMDENLIIQSAVPAVTREYAALGMDTSALQNNYILRTGGLMLLLSLLGAACSVTVGFFSARVAAGVSRDLRQGVFRKVINFSGTEMDRFSTASLITRSTNDITQLQMFVLMMIRMVVYAPIMGVGGILRAYNTDSSMWWIIAVAVGVLLTLVLSVFNIALPKFKIIQKLIDRLNLVTRESLSGLMVIRAFNRQAFTENRFDLANRNLTDTNLFVNRVMVVIMPAMMLIMNGVSLLIIWIGAQQVAQSQMQVGDMMAFIQYAIQVVFSFLMVSMMFIFLPRAAVSADRVAEVLETELVIQDPVLPKTLPHPSQGEIEFRDVSFRYPGAEEDVLHEISFTAHPGQTTAVIGSTGSGKSTVVNLIPRFYDVTGGAILLDGTDIREITQHDLRDKIGYIPQNSSLFSGTIESNLRYGDENASSEVLAAAAQIAQAEDFIGSSQAGLESEISQAGANLSGGQKQRLSIARALVKKAQVYIFDDSFSALDFKTDAALRKALREEMAASTLLIVTQRISTIRNAEQIIVLENGEMVGKGTHPELMVSCDTYREIALSQLSLEELS